LSHVQPDLLQRARLVFIFFEPLTVVHECVSVLVAEDGGFQTDKKAVSPSCMSI
jgi:hypothetical protein